MLPYNDRMLLLISGAFPFIVLDSCGSHAPTAPTIPWAAIPPHFPLPAAFCLQSWHAVRKSVEAKEIKFMLLARLKIIFHIF